MTRQEPPVELLHRLPPAVETYATHVASQRWLDPDTAFARVTPEARQEIAARFDEHVAALAALPADAGARLDERAAPRLWVTDSLADAAQRWLASWPQDRTARRRHPAPSWLAALEAARQLAVAEITRRVGPDDATLYINAIEGRVMRAVEAAAADSPTWRALMQSKPLPPPPGPSSRPYEFWEPAQLKAALHHVVWLAAFEPPRDAPGGGPPSPSSPWAPLLALWEQGAWPFASADDELAVIARPAERYAHDALQRERIEVHPALIDALGFRPPLLGYQVNFVMRGPLPPPELPG